MPRFKVTYEVDAPDLNHVPHPITVGHQIYNIRTSKVMGPKPRKDWFVVANGKADMSAKHTKKHAKWYISYLKKMGSKAKFSIIEAVK